MPLFRSALILLACATVAVAEPELRTLDGKTIKGTITAISKAELTVKEGADSVQVPLAKLLAVNFGAVRNPLGKYSEVRLVDDTNLLCTKITYKEKTIALTLTSGATVELAHDYVAHIVHEAQDAALRQQFAELAKKRLKRDRIVALRAGELNAIEGTFGEISAQAQTIEFRRDGFPDLSLPLDRLHGMIFYRLETPLDPPMCVVYDSQGNSIAAAALALEDGKYELTTTFGAKMVFAPDVLAKLDFNMGKLTYLSDLEPARVVERSIAGLIVRYRRDVNLDGEPIILDKQYDRGLSLHAHTELDYNLGGKYKQFRAIVGIDPRIESGSRPLLTIVCDGDKRFSETIGNNEFRPLTIDVRDVNTLRIIVSSSNLLDLHDHLTLAEARVSQ